MAVAYSHYKIVAVSLPKRFRDVRFTSETAVRHLDQEALSKIIRWDF
jgi:hypothetical protein